MGGWILSGPMYQQKLRFQFEQVIIGSIVPFWKAKTGITAIWSVKKITDHQLISCVVFRSDDLADVKCLLSSYLKNLLNQTSQNSITT